MCHHPARVNPGQGCNHSSAAIARESEDLSPSSRTVAVKNGHWQYGVMTESSPVPRKDIDDAKEAFRQWLVANGVLDIRLDVDRMMLEVQAIAEGREYDGPSTVGETMA